ncbi:MAG: PEP-CTERM sorting domain-containing protein [Phycisphaerae bacterium]|nr:PEP-CTERM sorting domain-containing protein [Phycisphaerae bacterium]
MCKRMALIAGITVCFAICNAADAGMIEFFVPSAPSGPSLSGTPSSTDALSILASAGSVAHDGDGDGWADAAPGHGCNYMGYVVLHHSNWRLNVHLRFFDWSEGYTPFWVGGGDGGGGGGSGGNMYSWPWNLADWDSLLDSDYEFGSSENPNPGNPGDFGVGEDGTVPEPCSLALLITGGVGMFLRRRT